MEVSDATNLLFWKLEMLTSFILCAVKDNIFSVNQIQHVVYCQLLPEGVRTYLIRTINLESRQSISKRTVRHPQGLLASLFISSHKRLENIE